MYPKNPCNCCTAEAAAAQTDPAMPQTPPPLNLPGDSLYESFDTPAMRGALQQFFSQNLGEYVVCEFLIGTNLTDVRQGILYSVGMSYFVLYQENNGTYLMCDIYSVKFVTFYQPGQRPNTTPASMRNASRR